VRLNAWLNEVFEDTRLKHILSRDVEKMTLNMSNHRYGLWIVLPHTKLVTIANYLLWANWQSLLVIKPEL